MHSDGTETNDSFLPLRLRLFIRRRLMELGGLALLSASGALTLALASWSVHDPSWNRAIEAPVSNLLGLPGAIVADELLNRLGLASAVLLFVPVLWAARLLALKPLPRPHVRSAWLIATVLLAAAFASLLPMPASWPLKVGLGGHIGDVLAGAVSAFFGLFLKPLPSAILAALLLGGGALFTTLRALAIGSSQVIAAAAILGEEKQDKVAEKAGALAHLHLRMKSAVKRRISPPAASAPSQPHSAAPQITRPDYLRAHDAASGDEADAPPVAAFAPRMRQRGNALLAGLKDGLASLLAHAKQAPAVAEEQPQTRAEPRIAPAMPEPARAEPQIAAVQQATPAADTAPVQATPASEATPAQPAACEPAPVRPVAAQPQQQPAETQPPAPLEPAQPQPAADQPVRIGAPMDEAFLPQELEEHPDMAEEAPATPAQAPAPATPQPPAAAAAPAPAARPQPPKPFELPPMDILALPDPAKRKAAASDEQLQESALQLAQVLEDFGVRGRIVNVCPGPVVTLYEFEPAPGVKSSRVIGLADDIARSMCAISARIAVVPGRNVIGIELPNARRETVYLREMLESEGYRKSKFKLPLALGKNIAGEPVFADLARMPHLLIAGTTGSGKSVGINTFIMSLLYKLTPEQCRLIMIDPKMLELSIYEGIPHLLAPVVTDPRKAIVALKWAVREMEDRYQKMAKLGVRNIDGYNARVKEALKKGERITRTVQTGFNPETGEPVFEERELDLQPLPYIVVIIDEMADLMMVAGKEIEGAVQRLAQMARAAGIHVIMATQRPSVDVITGTIKANFPTRISFQVTSKIDSRTILGEQGAEQLLGQGDMLYMAGGGRIVRLHGPFVSDEEVEQVVRHLKSQAAPDYVEAVLSEEEEASAAGGAAGGAVAASGDELYDKAVQIVLRDRKVSTSYIQRRLQIGYNKAATLIERMEAEGIISAPNSKGRREILVGGDSAKN